MRVHIKELYTGGGIGPVLVPPPRHDHPRPPVEGDGGAAVAGAGVVHGGHAVPVENSYI